MNLDPIAEEYSYMTPYQFASNNPDDMQSATLLAYHRPGGLHRLMLAVASRTAHIRRFCAIPHRSSAPIGTAQSHRDVIAQCKKRNRTKKQRLRNDKPTHKTAHLQAPPHKPKLRLAKELFSCQRSDCSTDRNIV